MHRCSARAWRETLRPRGKLLGGGEKGPGSNVNGGWQGRG